MYMSACVCTVLKNVNACQKETSQYQYTQYCAPRPRRRGKRENYVFIYGVDSLILLHMYSVSVQSSHLLKSLERQILLSGLQGYTSKYYNSGLTQQFCLMQEPSYMHAPRFTTATFGLHLALRLFEKMNNDVTTTDSTVSNPLMHARPPRAGGIACCSTISKSLSSSASHRAHGRGRRRVVVKSSFSSLYELTRHIIALAPHCCL